MGINKHIYHVVCIGLLLAHTGQLIAQDASSVWQTGKALLQAGKYYQAEQHFRSVYTSSEKNMQPMAGFYIGVCLYHHKAYEAAYRQFAELAVRFPTFPLHEGLHYWQGICAAEQQDLLRAFGHFAALKSAHYQAQATLYKTSLLSALTLSMGNLQLLARLYEKYPHDSLVADKLRASLRLYTSGGTSTIVDTLFRETLVRESVHELLASTQERAYRVAVLLPFFISEWPQKSIAKRADSFVWSLYEGIRSAQIALAETGIFVQLYPYDTRRSGQEVTKILSELENKDLDLIIGPLYWQAIAPVQAFAAAQDIPMINPLSSNPKLTAQSTHTWLFQADDITKAQAAAAYARQEYTNKYAALFCQQLPNSITTCEEYAKQMRQAGFEIVQERYLAKEDAGEIREWLGAVEITLIEALPEDSVFEEGSQYILRKGVGRYGEDAENWYKERWEIQPDSIGHIFVAATDPSFLSYAVSAVEQRPDTISILTEARWLKEREFSYAQLERLGVRFVAGHEVMAWETTRMKDFMQDFLQRWGEAPNEYACTGYELLWLMGETMARYGRYFMPRLQQDSSYYLGPLGTPMRYVPQRRDNQAVIVQSIQAGHLRTIYTYGKY